MLLKGRIPWLRGCWASSETIQIESCSLYWSHWCGQLLNIAAPYWIHTRSQRFNQSRTSSDNSLKELDPVKGLSTGTGSRNFIFYHSSEDESGTPLFMSGKYIMKRRQMILRAIEMEFCTQRSSIQQHWHSDRYQPHTRTLSQLKQPVFGTYCPKISTLNWLLLIQGSLGLFYGQFSWYPTNYGLHSV